MSREPGADVVGVSLAPGAAGGGGALGGGPSTGTHGGPGAFAGANLAEGKVAFSGEVRDVADRKRPAGPLAPLRTGLGDLKRRLARGEWPKPGTVASGGLLQRMPPDAPGAMPAVDPVAVQAEIAPSPFSPGKHVVRVSIRAKPAPPAQRPAANLVFAIDVSDSMKGANRLPLVQEGVQLLAERLRSDDRIAVVTYAAEAREVRASDSLGEGGGDLRSTLDALVASGRTNGHEGLTLAYATARAARTPDGINAVILCTDGNFNLGETDEHALAALAADHAVEGIKLSVFGFGRTDRNDLRLELLAESGGGRSCYVNTREEAERLLAGQVDGLLQPVATNLQARVEFDPARVAAVREIAGQIDEPVGELLPGRTLSILYEIELKPSAGGKPEAWATTQVTYRTPDGTRAERVRETFTGGPTDWERAGEPFRFAVAMGELGRILQGKPEDAGFALDRLEAWVGQMLPDDRGGYRRDLLDAIAAARRARNS